MILRAQTRGMIAKHEPPNSLDSWLTFNPRGKMQDSDRDANSSSHMS